MDQIRLLIVDDHPKIRTYLAARLGREPGFEVICEASTGEQAIHCALTNQPDVILIDPMLRDGQGLEAIRQIRAGLPRTEVVVLTAFVDTSLQLELRKIGVLRVLEKNLESSHLIEILRQINPPHTVS